MNQESMEDSDTLLNTAEICVDDKEQGRFDQLGCLSLLYRTSFQC